MRTRIKVCGLTRLDDVMSAIDAGVDALGFVFYSESPRSITAMQVADFEGYIPPYVQIVGLFVNATAEDVRQVLSYVKLDILQFHGNESPEQCAAIANEANKRWYKAIQVKDDMDLLAEIQKYKMAGASAILLDAYHPLLKGGTGHSFDWSRFPKSDIPLILAGGLNAENVKEAILQTTPYAVDVSGGVESSKGIKDNVKIKVFVQQVMQISYGSL